MQASEVIAQSKLYKSDTQQVTKYLISLLGEDKNVLTKVPHFRQTQRPTLELQPKVTVLHEVRTEIPQAMAEEMIKTQEMSPNMTPTSKTFVPKNSKPLMMDRTMSMDSSMDNRNMSFEPPEWIARIHLETTKFALPSEAQQQSQSRRFMMDTKRQPK